MSTFFRFPVLKTALLISSISVTLSCFASTSFENIEQSSGGRLGISALDTNSHQLISYRASERFPFDSTFKFMLATAILKQSMTYPDLLQEVIHYQKSDVLWGNWNPETSKTQNIKNGMTISDLCAAAVSDSDDTAANLLIKKLGGPQEITTFARSIGDQDFRLDRIEPALNSAIPGDLRDTTTPHSMTQDLNKILLGNIPGPAQIKLLETWLKNCSTGDKRIRTAVPKSWTVGDKTGTGDYGTTNDIGIIWPPGCKPILLTIYFAQPEPNSPPRDDVIASATKIILDQLAEGDACIKD